MNKLERTLLIAETGGAEPRLVVRSNTRVDAGRWWRGTPLWVCVTDQDVVVLAAARRHYLQRFPIGDCLGSHYCHITGELVIEAGEDLRFSRLAMSPTDALRVMDAFDSSAWKENKLKDGRPCPATPEMQTENLDSTILDKDDA